MFFSLHPQDSVSTFCKWHSIEGYTENTEVMALFPAKVEAREGS